MLHVERSFVVGDSEDVDYAMPVPRFTLVREVARELVVNVPGGGEVILAVGESVTVGLDAFTFEIAHVHAPRKGSFGGATDRRLWHVLPSLVLHVLLVMLLQRQAAPPGDDGEVIDRETRNHLLTLDAAVIARNGEPATVSIDRTRWTRASDSLPKTVAIHYGELHGSFGALRRTLLRSVWFVPECPTDIDDWRSWDEFSFDPPAFLPPKQRAFANFFSPRARDWSSLTSLGAPIGQSVAVEVPGYFQYGNRKTRLLRATLEPEPEADLRHVLRARFDPLTSCLLTHDFVGPVTVTLQVEPSGDVSAVGLEGVQGEAKHCLSHELRATTFFPRASRARVRLVIDDLDA